MSQPPCRLSLLHDLNEFAAFTTWKRELAEMFARMRHMVADTMANTETFYAPDACERVVALFRSFGGAEAVPPSSNA